MIKTMLCECGGGLRHGPLAVQADTHTHGLHCETCEKYFSLTDPMVPLVLHRKRKDGSHTAWYYARAHGSGPITHGGGMTQTHMDAQNALLDAVNGGRTIYVKEASCRWHPEPPRRLVFF